ncbi:SsrA-binding protein SmpB [Sutterella parvirubra]|nr:SsrA-binding protein SmpB [Sutterella parvirubra]
MVDSSAAEAHPLKWSDRRSAGHAGELSPRDAELPSGTPGKPRASDPPRNLKRVEREGIPYPLPIPRFKLRGPQTPDRPTGFKEQKNITEHPMALIQNKRARHDYAIEEKYEAGIVLRGWEVKSVRASRAQINLAHIYVREGELFLCNAHMTPADQVCTHETLETNRTRKLLMHKKEIAKLIGKVERAGYTLVPLDLHFTRGRVKLSLALARGKREFEKRADESKKEWKREQERLMKKDARGRHVL